MDYPGDRSRRNRFLTPFAESNDVTLREILDEVGRTPINRDATVCVLRNLIHNAIKYSREGLSRFGLPGGRRKNVAKKVIRVDVNDKEKALAKKSKRRFSN